MQRQPPLFCLSLLRSCISWCSSCSSRTTGAGAAAAGAELRWTWRAGEGKGRGPRRTATFESERRTGKEHNRREVWDWEVPPNTWRHGTGDRTNGACFVPPPSYRLTVLPSLPSTGQVTFRLGWSTGHMWWFSRKTFRRHCLPPAHGPPWSQHLVLVVSISPLACFISSLADLHFASFDWSRHASHDIPTISKLSVPLCAFKVFSVWFGYTVLCLRSHLTS